MSTSGSNTKDPLKLFGARVVHLRNQRKWSQERLSLESGLARSYLGGVERGKRNIALINICRLADALSVTPDELLRFESEKNAL